MTEDKDLTEARRVLQQAAELREAQDRLDRNLRHVRRATTPLFLVYSVLAQAIVVAIPLVVLLGGEAGTPGAWVLFAMLGVLVVEAFVIAGLSLWIARLSKVLAALHVLMRAADRGGGQAGTARRAPAV